MTKLNWGMIGGGEGSQIGPAHRLGAGLDGVFEFSAGALDHRPEAGRDYGKRLGLGGRPVPMATGARCWTARKTRDDRIDLVTVATPTPPITRSPRPFLRRAFMCSAKSR
jgi:predicted dehydrogenase